MRPSIGLPVSVEAAVSIHCLRWKARFACQERIHALGPGVLTSSFRRLTSCQ